MTTGGRGGAATPIVTTAGGRGGPVERVEELARQWTPAGPPEAATALGDDSRQFCTRLQRLLLAWAGLGILHKGFSPQIGGPAERALYDKLKAQYDAEVESCDTDTAKAMLMKKLRQQYDQEVLSTTMEDHAAIQCGDVVQAPVEGMFYEGVVIAINGMMCTVDFGEDDVQSVLLDVCRRVLAWHTIEVGDEVKVRDVDSALEFVGHVTQVTTGPVGPVYEVKYDETDEVEKHIAPDRLRKVKSARSSAIKRWHKAYTVIVAAHAFEQAGKGELDMSSESKEESKIDRTVSGRNVGDGAVGVLPNADGLDPDYEGAKYARGAQAARGEHHESKDGHVELLATDDVVYADEGSALDPDYEGAKYARGAQAAGAMPEE